MPREITLVSAEPIGFAALVDAGVAVDGRLVARSLFGGWIVQLVDAAGQALLSVEQSRRLDDTFDAGRLTWSELPAEPLWWTEGTAPWDEPGEVGVRICRALADATGADLYLDLE